MIVLLASPPARADSGVDVKFQGPWAAPDCGNDSEGLILTKNFYLKSTEAGSTFSRADFARHGDYAVLTVAGTAHPAQHTEDSILKIGDAELADVKTWPQAWDDLSLAGRNEYTGCPEAPQAIPVPLVHVMKYIDSLAETCGASMTRACEKLLFSIADTNGNKKISPAEFRKAAAMLFVFAPLAGGQSVATVDLEAAYKTGMGEGRKAADALLAARDANHSGDLDEKELRGIAPLLDSPAVQQALTQTAAVIPAFAAAQHR